MLIELHLLQNFAPSNLNRDDTGSPKDCEFGGFRRARISSQCFKRAMRTHFKEAGLLPEGALASRTKRLVDALASRLVERGKDDAEARAVAEIMLAGAGLTVVEGKTQYLLFLADREIAALAGICADYWEDLHDIAAAQAEGVIGAKKTGRATKQSGKEAVPAKVKKALDTVLDGRGAADLALFGRMIADRPDRNVDAACQVAHAISTNKVSVEFDFYTAVDDLKPDDTAGADMLGTIEFNSACFYRYANVDANELLKNLGGDEELARQTIAAFIRAAIEALPTGKQNSMAAQNPPSLVFAVLRERGLWSLANAFTRPMSGNGDGLVANSVAALDGYWRNLTTMYGQKGIVGSWLSALDDAGINYLAATRVEGVDTLVEELLGAVRFTNPGMVSAR